MNSADRAGDSFSRAGKAWKRLAATASPIPKDKKGRAAALPLFVCWGIPLSTRSGDYECKSREGRHDHRYRYDDNAGRRVVLHPFTSPDMIFREGHGWSFLYQEPAEQLFGVETPVVQV